MSRRSESNWVRTFEVTSPTRHKKGFTVYKVISKVFPRTFPEGVTTLVAWKRYNDFKKLYKELQTIHKDLHLSGEFPKFPKARPFGFGRFDYEIVEERKKSAYALLEFAATHSQLFTSKVFVQFFEHGYHVKEQVVHVVGDQGDAVANRGECLVPERLWVEKETQLVSGNEDDTISVSSAGSSTAETATFTDSDSMISSSILSTVGETPSLMHPSNTVDFGSLSFQSSVPSKSLRESGDSRSEATTSEKSSNSHQRTRAHVGIGERDSSFGESYTACGTTSAGSQSNLSLVSNSKSLPSLDAISSNGCGGAGPSQSQEVVKVKRKNFKPSWSLSLRRKPNGIAGFFDFLPIFPKMAEQKKVSEEKLFSDSLTSSYICEAAGHFAVAQQNESNGELPNALESYKEGIKILLVGGQNDKDPKRRLIVRNKVEKYLSKAEQLHSSLSDGTNSSTVLFSPKKIQSILQPENSLENSKNIKEELKSSSLEELRSYKVVGVAATGILIVVNVDERSGPKCYCVKVLQKSAIPLNPIRRTLIASQVPFMVKLIKWFDSENTIILLMQYAGGGKLEDFVSTYQSKPIAIIPHDTSPCQDDNISDTAEGRASDEGSLMEGKNPTSALASAFAEQLENNSFRLNTNFEKEELCESYARLFQESDSEDCSYIGQDKSNSSLEDEILERRDRIESNLEEAAGIRYVGRQQGGCRGRSDKVCETEGNTTVNTTFTFSTRPGTLQEVEKLAVDSFHGNVDANEALENESKVTTTSSAGTTNTRLKVNGLRKQTSSDLKVSTSLFPDNNSLISWTNLDTVDTGDLIESSKVLIQTVSRTLTQCEVFPESGVNTNSKAMHTKSMPSTELNCSSQSSEHQRDYNNSSLKLPLPDSRIREELVSNQTESLSLSGEKQRAETNETENNNNKQQASGPLDLMSGRISKDELLEKISEETKFLEASNNATTPSHYCLRPSHTNHNDRSESSEDISPEQPIQRMVPECCVKVWVAEMVLALEKLHALGLTYGDLGMRNVLLGENGHILLSFTSQWAEVDHIPKRSDWIAPEARAWLENCEEKIHFSADWWSLGAILFYLLTGKGVQSCHPEGFHANTALKILDKNLMEEDISQHAKSLMTELLQINPNLRLGYYGAEEIKTHPFFDGFDWDNTWLVGCAVLNSRHELTKGTCENILLVYLGSNQRVLLMWLPDFQVNGNL
ncbi:unnamed protein product, partial [Allacma fusca]